MEGYLASSGEPARAFAPVMRSPEILEQLCMPDYGSLVGFDERLQPLTSGARMSRTQAAQKAAAQAGVRAFHREWVRYRRIGEPAARRCPRRGARRSCCAMLTRFVAPADRGGGARVQLLGRTTRTSAPTRSRASSPTRCCGCCRT